MMKKLGLTVLIALFISMAVAQPPVPGDSSGSDSQEVQDRPPMPEDTQSQDLDQSANASETQGAVNQTGEAEDESGGGLLSSIFEMLAFIL